MYRNSVRRGRYRRERRYRSIPRSYGARHAFVVPFYGWTRPHLLYTNGDFKPAHEIGTNRSANKVVKPQIQREEQLINTVSIPIGYDQAQSHPHA